MHNISAGGPGSGRRPNGEALAAKYRDLAAHHREQADLHGNEYYKQLGDSKPPLPENPVRSYHGDMMHWHKTAARNYANAANFHQAGMHNEGTASAKVGNKYSALTTYRTPPAGAKTFEGKIAAKAPKGFKNTVERMKRHAAITNPYALAWWEKDQGDKAHPVYPSNKKPADDHSGKHTRGLRAGGPGSGRYPAGTHQQGETSNAVQNQGYKELSSNNGSRYFYKDNNKNPETDQEHQPDDHPRLGNLEHYVRVDTDGSWHHGAREGAFGSGAEDFYHFDKDQEKADATYPESKTFKAPI